MWIMGIAVAAIIGGVVLVLTPEGATEKSVKTIVSFFLIASMVLPLSKVEKLNLSLQTMQNEAVENSKIADAAVDAFVQNLKDEISSTLENNGIKINEINISANISNNEISVEQIQIILNEKDKRVAEEILKNHLDLTAQIKGEKDELIEAD